MNYTIEQKKTINFVEKRYKTGQIEVNTYETKFKNINLRFDKKQINKMENKHMINKRMGKFYSTIAKEREKTSEEIKLLQIYNRKKEYVIRNKIIDLVKNNQEKWRYFITLTFADNKKNNDYKKVKTIFKNWVKDIKKNHNLRFHYIYVIEEHKSGLFHIHLIASDIGKEYLKQAINNKLTSKTYGKKIPNQYNLTLWRYGFTNVKRINTYSDKVATYVGKYITKVLKNDLFIDFNENNNTFKKNSLNFYGCSRGLDRLKKTTTQKEIIQETTLDIFGEVLTNNLDIVLEKEVKKIAPYANLEKSYQSKTKNISRKYTQSYFIDKKTPREEVVKCEKLKL